MKTKESRKNQNGANFSVLGSKEQRVENVNALIKKITELDPNPSPLAKHVLEEVAHMLISDAEMPRNDEEALLPHHRFADKSIEVKKIELKNLERLKSELIPSVPSSKIRIFKHRTPKNSPETAYLGLPEPYMEVTLQHKHIKEDMTPPTQIWFEEGKVAVYNKFSIKHDYDVETFDSIDDAAIYVREFPNAYYIEKRERMANLLRSHL